MCGKDKVPNLILIVYLGEVEGVEVPLLRLLEGHDLDVHGPGGMVPGGDGVVEVADGVVGVLLGHLQYSTVQCSIVQYSTVQHSTARPPRRPPGG